MSRTYKDSPTRRDHMSHYRRELGARLMLGFGAYRDDDPADDADRRQALAEYVRQGGYVDLLLGRKA